MAHNTGNPGECRLRWPQALANAGLNVAEAPESELG
jgi:hypothetical protein